MNQQRKHLIGSSFGTGSRRLMGCLGLIAALLAGPTVGYAHSAHAATMSSICTPSGDKAICEAYWLAATQSPAVSPSIETVEAIRADLAAIRTAYQGFADVTYVPPWSPGALLVTLELDAWAQYLAGEYHGFDSLNQTYGPVTATIFVQGQHLLFLTFEDRGYNMPKLAQMYSAADGVNSASVNGTHGERDSTIRHLAATYEFVRGWDDCLLGCIFHHTWVFEIRNGKAQLLSDSGDPLPTTLFFASIFR